MFECYKQQRFGDLYSLAKQRYLVQFKLWNVMLSDVLIQKKICLFCICLGCLPLSCNLVVFLSTVKAACNHNNGHLLQILANLKRTLYVSQDNDCLYKEKKTHYLYHYKINIKVLLTYRSRTVTNRKLILSLLLISLPNTNID